MEILDQELYHEEKNKNEALPTIKTKVDQLLVYDPQNTQDTIITRELYRSMDLTLQVVYQF